MIDEEILNLINEKNQEGLTYLLDKYGGMMAYIVRNTGNFSEEDISECLSDVLFTVWKRVKKFDRTKASFKTWVVIVTRGCAIDFLRKNSKHKNTISLEDIKELHSETSAFAELEDNGIIEVLQQLPPPDNEIFYRRFVLGESLAEISKLLDMTQDSIYKRIQRGKEKLKNLMKREGCYYV